MDPEDLPMIALGRLLAENTFEQEWGFPDEDRSDKRVRRVPQDGDVVMTADGLVRRIGDQPRSRRHSVTNYQTQAAQLAKLPNKEVAHPMSSLEQREAQLRSALLEWAGVKALLDRFHGQEPPIATVLRWIKRYDNREARMVLDTDSDLSSGRGLSFTVTAPQEYVFVAFRAPNGDWFTTSLRGASKRTWDALLEEIGDSPCEVASEWTDVPAPERPTEESLDPTTWAKTLFGPKKDAPAQAENIDL